MSIHGVIFVECFQLIPLPLKVCSGKVQSSEVILLTLFVGAVSAVRSIARPVAAWLVCVLPMVVVAVAVVVLRSR